MWVTLTIFAGRGGRVEKSLEERDAIYEQPTNSWVEVIKLGGSWGNIECYWSKSFGKCGRGKFNTISNKVKQFCWLQKNSYSWIKLNRSKKIQFDFWFRSCCGLQSRASFVEIFWLQFLFKYNSKKKAELVVHALDWSFVYMSELHETLGS